MNAARLSQIARNVKKCDNPACNRFTKKADRHVCKHCGSRRWVVPFGLDREAYIEYVSSFQSGRKAGSPLPVKVVEVINGRIQHGQRQKHQAAAAPMIAEKDLNGSSGGMSPQTASSEGSASETGGASTRPPTRTEHGRSASADEAFRGLSGLSLSALGAAAAQRQVQRNPSEHQRRGPAMQDDERVMGGPPSRHDHSATPPSRHQHTLSISHENDRFATQHARSAPNNDEEAGAGGAFAGIADPSISNHSSSGITSASALFARLGAVGGVSSDKCEIRRVGPKKRLGPRRPAPPRHVFST